MKVDRHLIRRVLSLPTAPFYEAAVVGFIKDFVKELGLACQQDRFGNLKVIYQKGKGRTPFVLSAHMDHPGFEVVRGGIKPVVYLLGGVPDRYFAGAKVVVWEGGRITKTKVVRCLSKQKRRYQLGAKLAKGSFGTFDLPSVRIQNQILYTKAADDMINVALLLNFLKELVRRKAKARVIFLFTRAEEVGFVGALGVAKQRWIRQNIPIVVLEASSAKAGKVKIGGGPVLRVGDKVSTFSHRLDLWLQAAAKNIPHQRALLSGGRCEATVFTEKGYQASCLAFPLGNYHNVGPKGYAPEYISLKDYQNLLRLLAVLAQMPPPQMIQKRKIKELDQIFQKWQGRLKRIAKG